MGGGAGLFDHDRGYGRRFVVGADEAGRGCLAGPLVAAAVVFDLARLTHIPDALGALDDSKRLTARRRAGLVAPILRYASRTAVAVRDPGRIDREGIQAVNLNALAVALERAGGGIEDEALQRLCDGFPLPGAADHLALVGGDRTSAAVAAASVIAKQVRDRLMQGAHARYPAYGFDRHAGYPTPAHRAALRSHGPCPLHRRSFSWR